MAGEPSAIVGVRGEARAQAYRSPLFVSTRIPALAAGSAWASLGAPVRDSPRTTVAQDRVLLSGAKGSRLCAGGKGRR